MTRNKKQADSKPTSTKVRCVEWVHGGSTRGINSRTRKLDEAAVHEIRAIYDAGGRGKEYAALYGIHWKAFDKIGMRRSWKSLAEVKIETIAEKMKQISKKPQKTARKKS